MKGITLDVMLQACVLAYTTSTLEPNVFQTSNFGAKCVKKLFLLQVVSS